MQFAGALLSVKDIKKSIEFYETVLDLSVVADFGANVTLSGGVYLQTEESWASFIGKKLIKYGNSYELYFEETDMDGFVSRLKKQKVKLVHKLKTHPWGQRVVRFYDPDGHIIEVGENMLCVVGRFLDGGLSKESVALRMDVPLDYVEDCIKKIEQLKVIKE